MISEKDEIVLFENGELALEVNVSPQLETVWLSSNQMALLYGRDEKTIRKHVNKIFADGELDRESNTQKACCWCHLSQLLSTTSMSSYPSVIVSIQSRASLFVNGQTLS